MLTRLCWDKGIEDSWAHSLFCNHVERIEIDSNTVVWFTCRKPGHCPKVFQPFVPAKPCVHDGDCNEGEKCCVYFGNPVCAPAFLSEPGCPLREKLGPCVELCSSDSDCSVGEKCCSNGCGYECMSTTPLKPGICGHKVFTPWCYSFCNHDGDCPGEKKCCPTKCGHVCKNPIFLESV
uniref:WAP four-disulfide core domain 2 n=1 Tax=Fundulus heteroclitus TaxID=8078 RepID=A0A3Q2PLC9_FUNHE